MNEAQSGYLGYRGHSFWWRAVGVMTHTLDIASSCLKESKVKTKQKQTYYSTRHIAKTDEISMLKVREDLEES